MVVGEYFFGWENSEGRVKQPPIMLLSVNNRI